MPRISRKRQISRKNKNKNNSRKKYRIRNKKSSRNPQRRRSSRRMSGGSWNLTKGQQTQLLGLLQKKPELYSSFSGLKKESDLWEADFKLPPGKMTEKAFKYYFGETSTNNNESFFTNTKNMRVKQRLQSPVFTPLGLNMVMKNNHSKEWKKKLKSGPEEAVKFAKNKLNLGY